MIQKIYSLNLACFLACFLSSVAMHSAKVQAFPAILVIFILNVNSYFLDSFVLNYPPVTLHFQ